MYTYFYCIYRKLADKKLVLGWRKTNESVVLCSRSPKHLFLKNQIKKIFLTLGRGGDIHNYSMLTAQGICFLDENGAAYQETDT